MFFTYHVFYMSCWFMFFHVINVMLVHVFCMPCWFMIFYMSCWFMFFTCHVSSCEASCGFMIVHVFNFNSDGMLFKKTCL